MRFHQFTIKEFSLVIRSNIRRVVLTSPTGAFQDGQSTGMILESSVVRVKASARKLG